MQQEHVQENDDTQDQEPMQVSMEENMGTPDVEQKTTEQHVSRVQNQTLIGRLLGNTIIGTLIYVYFGLFVAFHVVLSVQFFLHTLHPVIGIGAWIITMVLGGLCVVALTVWREKVKTFWSDEAQ